MSDATKLPRSGNTAREVRRLRAIFEEIHNELDYCPWDADTVQTIADIMQRHGYPIRGPEEGQRAAL